jgi:hypothetical protein
MKRCRKCGATIPDGAEYCDLSCLREWCADRGYLVMGNGVGTVQFREADGDEEIEQTVDQVYRTLARRPLPLEASKIGIYEGEPN